MTEVLQRKDEALFKTLQMLATGLKGKDWVRHPELIQRLIQLAAVHKPGLISIIVREILSAPGWQKHPHIVQSLMHPSKTNTWMVEILRYIKWIDHEALIRDVISSPETNVSTLMEITDFLKNSEWKERRDFALLLCEKVLRDSPRDTSTLQVLENFLNQEHWVNDPLIFKAFAQLDRKNPGRLEPYIFQHPDLVFAHGFAEIYAEVQGRPFRLFNTVFGVMGNNNYVLPIEILGKMLLEADAKELKVLDERVFDKGGYYAKMPLFKEAITYLQGQRLGVLNAVLPLKLNANNLQRALRKGFPLTEKWTRLMNPSVQPHRVSIVRCELVF